MAEAIPTANIMANMVAQEEIERMDRVFNVASASATMVFISSKVRRCGDIILRSRVFKLFTQASQSPSKCEALEESGATVKMFDWRGERESIDGGLGCEHLLQLKNFISCPNKITPIVCVQMTWGATS